MATDITNVYPSFSVFLSPFYKAVLRADFDRSMDRYIGVNSTRASCVLKKKRRNSTMLHKNATIYILSSCKYWEWKHTSLLGKQTHWKLDLTRMITSRYPRKRKICTGNIFITNGSIISVSLYSWKETKGYSYMCEKVYISSHQSTCTERSFI